MVHQSALRCYPNFAMGLFCALGALTLAACAPSRVTGGQASRTTSQGSSVQQSLGGEERQTLDGAQRQQSQQGLSVTVTPQGAVTISNTLLTRSDREASTSLASTRPSTLVATTQPSETLITRQPDIQSSQGLPKLAAAREGQLSAVSWEQIDWIKQRASYIYPIAAVVCLILAALAFSWGRTMLALSLGVVAGVLAALPYLGWLLALIIGLFLVGAIAVFVYGRFYKGQSLRSEALAGAAKLVREGKPAEAIAALRASDPELDAAFSGQK